MKIIEQYLHAAEQLHGVDNAEKIERALLHRFPPTVEQLAMLSAQLLSRHNGDCQAAIADAARLWVACVREHPKLGKRDWWYNPTPEITVTKPKRFPVPFDEMLRLLMPTIPKANDRIPRYREYLSEIPKMNGRKQIGFTGKDWACERLANERQRQFNESEYLVIAHSFIAWWNRKLSETRKQARKKRKSKTPS